MKSFNLITPPSEKIAGGFQQVSKKEGCLGEGIFARLLFRTKSAAGMGSGSSLRQQRGKDRKNCFLT